MQPQGKFAPPSLEFARISQRSTLEHLSKYDFTVKSEMAEAFK